MISTQAPIREPMTTPGPEPRKVASETSWPIENCSLYVRIHSVCPPADGSGLPYTARSRMSHGASTARQATALTTPTLTPTRGRRIHHAMAGAVARRMPSMRAMVARPTSPPDATIHQAGRAAVTARVAVQSAAAPTAPNTAKFSTSG